MIVQAVFRFCQDVFSSSGLYGVYKDVIRLVYVEVLFATSVMGNLDASQANHATLMQFLGIL